MKKRWTKKSLPKKLLAVLCRGNTTIKLKSLNSKSEVANCSWTKGGLKINIDPFQCSIFYGVIHELLHFVFRETHEQKMEYWVEEPQIAALEEEVTKYIQQHPRMFRQWKKAINRKL